MAGRVKDALLFGVSRAAAAIAVGARPFEILIAEARRQAMATLVEELFTWVAEKQGRRVVLEWEGDMIAVRSFEPDGTPAQEEEKADG